MIFTSGFEWPHKNKSVICKEHQFISKSSLACNRFQVSMVTFITAVCLYVPKCIQTVLTSSERGSCPQSNPGPHLSNSGTKIDPGNVSSLNVWQVTRLYCRQPEKNHPVHYHKLRTSGPGYVTRLTHSFNQRYSYIKCHAILNYEWSHISFGL